MLATIEINGKKLLPIKQAASSVKYTRDYVARLAREGKIVASQVGRQWFVDVDSLKNFSAEADILETVRKQDLRAERKRELMAKDCLAELDQVVVDKIHARRFDALAVTCAALCLGLFAGIGFYTAANLPESKLASIYDSLPVATLPAPETDTQKALLSVDTSAFIPVVNETDTLLLTTVVERPVFESESEVRSLGEMAEGILVLARETKMKNADDVAALFSDEVEVTFTDEVTGIIKYDQGEGKVIEYPFVAVPTIHGEEAEVMTTEQ